MHLKRLGPYELGKPLGKGGMGSVFEAVDSATGQRVAVKALSPHLAMSEGFRERFEAEIDSLKILRHDGIVRLYGYGEQDGVLFYSMEVVDGSSLEDEMRAGRRFTWREVTSIGIQLCMALKHAHDHGIIHRDIKPANILLYDDDKVKLADFGIARLFGTSQLTIAGGVLGTADYMSPEQADGRPVTAKCDQYSLGGVLYALLAGRPPFRAASLPQMLQMQRFAQPEPLRRYAPDTPEQLEEIILRLLAKEPGDRYPNTQVLARHLRAMYMALSRPAPDDFALASEPKIDECHPDWEHSLVIAPTQAEPTANAGQAHVAEPTANPRTPSPDAQTLAAEDIVSAPSEHPASTANGAPGSAAPSIVRSAAPPPVSRFTTIEEEEAKHRAEQQRSFISTGLQLGTLAAAIAGVVFLAVYLSRPPDADALYESIMAKTNRGQDESLSVIADEVQTFLQEYPDDSRAAEVGAFRDQIELDRLDRRLQARSAIASGEQLLPAESLYLKALRLGRDSPADSVRILESIAVLFGGESPPLGEVSGAPIEVDEIRRRQSMIAKLAERRAVGLREAIQRDAEADSKYLQERLDAALALSEDDADRAAAMLEAIVRLFEGEDWAADQVSVAKRKLAEIQDDSK